MAKLVGLLHKTLLDLITELSQGSRKSPYRDDTEISGEGPCREDEEGVDGSGFLFPSPSLLFTAAVVPLGLSLFSGEMLTTSASADARMLPESRDKPPRQRSCPVAI